MKTFNEIPTSEPSTDLLNELQLPEDLKKLFKKRPKYCRGSSERVPVVLGWNFEVILELA